MNKKEIEKILAPSITKTALAEKVEIMVKREGFGYVEAIMHICKENEYDPEDIAKLVKGPLKQKMQIEAEKLSLLPKTTGNTIEFE